MREGQFFLEEGVQRGWVRGEHIVDTGTHVRVQGAVKNHVLKSLNASTAVCAQPLLPWHSLPAARFFGTPVGAGAPLRKCLTAAPLAHVCDESRWSGQAGCIKRAVYAKHIVLQPGGALAGCRRLQHFQLPLPARLAQRCSADGPWGCQVELHADSRQCYSQLLRPELVCWLAGAGG